MGARRFWGVGTRRRTHNESLCRESENLGMSLKPAKQSRWMNWTPATRVSENAEETEPTKPSKPGFVGFEGTDLGKGPEIPLQPDRQPDLKALRTSMERLEAAQIFIAVSADGTIRIAQGNAQVRQLKKDGLTVYSPADMYHYVQLEPHERCMLRNFQEQFGGSIEWKS